MVKFGSVMDGYLSLLREYHSYRTTTYHTAATDIEVYRTKYKNRIIYSGRVAQKT